jgi:hypothetical protein
MRRGDQEKRNRRQQENQEELEKRDLDETIDEAFQSVREVLASQVFHPTKMGPTPAPTQIFSLRIPAIGLRSR